MSESNGSIIVVKDLVKRFGDRAVLDGINLEIPTGKTTVIMGGSGCGKSTFLRHLVALHKPSEGEVWIDGENIVGMNETNMNGVRRKFGMLFQSATETSDRTEVLAGCSTEKVRSLSVVKKSQSTKMSS